VVSLGAVKLIGTFHVPSGQVSFETSVLLLTWDVRYYF